MMNISAMQGWFLVCPSCHDRTLLPPESRIGIYEGLSYRTKGTWPLVYLCWQCGRLSAVAGGAARLDLVSGPNLALGRQVLWWIDCECAQENCEGTFALCYRHLEIETPERVCEVVADKIPTVFCKDGNHDFSFRVEKMKAEKLES